MKNNTQSRNFNTIYLILIVLFTTSNAFSQNWEQKGNEITGNSIDQMGYSMDMPNSHTIAIGAPYSAIESGYVKVYDLINNNWVQRGNILTGEVDDQFGFSVSMPDSKTLAVGANSMMSDTSYVKVYRWSNGEWIQKGNTMVGSMVGDQFAKSVSMPDSNTIAIGAIATDKVIVNHWNGNKWVQKGNALSDHKSFSQFGFSIRMPNKSTLIVGAPRKDSDFVDEGYVKIYHWINNEWIQKGSMLTGNGDFDFFGWSVDMPDTSTLIVGAPDANNSVGYVKVFKWVNNDWVQKGMKISGDIYESGFGHQVSMPDSDHFIVASNDSNINTEDGCAKVYHWVNNDWVQEGDSLLSSGENESRVSMPDDSTIAFGGIGSFIKIFRWNAPINLVNPASASATATYPNPTNGEVTVTMDTLYQEVHVNVFNNSGAKILQKEFYNTKKFKLNITQNPGTYYIDVSAHGKKKILKVIKN